MNPTPNPTPNPWKFVGNAGRGEPPALGSPAGLLLWGELHRRAAE